MASALFLLWSDINISFIDDLSNITHNMISFECQVCQVDQFVLISLLGRITDIGKEFMICI